MEESADTDKWELPAWNRLLGAISGWLPFLFVFVLLPTQLYLTNILDFEYNWALLIPYYAIAVICLLAICVLGLFKYNFMRRIFDGLFFVGVFFIVSDAFIPLNWGLLDGGHSLTESMPAALLQSVIAAGLISLYIKVPTANVRVLGGFLVVGLLVWQALMLPGLASTPTENVAADNLAAVRVPGSAEGDRPDIYHVVFDGYASPNLITSLERTGLKDEFDGFTFFERNLSNFINTDASVPSFLTGKLFSGGSFKDFQLASKSAGLGAVLMDAGYEMSVYAPNRARFWSHNDADYTFTNDELVANDNDKLFALLMLVRSAPEFLRQEAHEYGTSLIWGRHAEYGYYKRLSVPVFDRFLDDNRAPRDTSRYTFIHLILPHSPYVWDNSCEPASKSDFSQQTDCATRLMGRLLDELKTAGRYEDALIVFQSDHGTYTETSLASSFPEFPEAVRDHLETQNISRDTQEIYQKAHALLLVKPPKSESEPILVSNRLTQLADIPATVVDLLGLSKIETDGQSVFQPIESDREIILHAGIRDALKAGREQNLGRELAEANISRIGYSDGSGWRVLTDVKATHEGW